MLEIYRACPRCGAHQKSDVGHCEACGQILGKEPVSRGRRLVDLVVLALVLVVGAGTLVKPEWLARLSGGSPAAAPQDWAGRKPWTRSGAEPPARVWAYRLENSLEDACNQTYGRFNDKLLGPTLNFQLLGGNLVAARETYRIAKKTKTPIPRLTPEEVADARTAIGDRAPFVTSCLVSAYARIEPCVRFKDKLTHADATACFVAPVQQMLGAIAYRLCAERAQLQRVRDLCALSATRAGEQPAAKAAAGM